MGFRASVLQESGLKVGGNGRADGMNVSELLGPSNYHDSVRTATEVTFPSQI